VPLNLDAAADTRAHTCTMEGRAWIVCGGESMNRQWKGEHGLSVRLCMERTYLGLQNGIPGVRAARL